MGQRGLHLLVGVGTAGSACGTLEQVFHQLVLVQTAQGKALFVQHFCVFFVKHHQQALAKKGFDRFAQKLGELLQRERHGAVGHPREQALALGGIGHRRLVHGAPLAGKAEQGAARFKVAAAEGL